MSKFGDEPLHSLWSEIADKVTPVVQRYRRHLGSFDVEIKPDSTFLTDADVEVQSLIVSTIRTYDPTGYIVAEEATESPINDALIDGPVAWVVDPIDGTSQFIKEDSSDFCTAVAVVVNGAPTASLIIGYELGANASPVRITAYAPDSRISINDVYLTTNEMALRAQRRASMTRGVTSTPPPIEIALKSDGYEIKSRTTSQTVDIARTTPISRRLQDGHGFDFFYRENQKVWDGVPGMCLAAAFGMAIETLHPSRDFIPLSRDFLRKSEPTFNSTLIGPPDQALDLVRRFGVFDAS